MKGLWRIIMKFAAARYRDRAKLCVERGMAEAERFEKKAAWCERQAVAGGRSI